MNDFLDFLLAINTNIFLISISIRACIIFSDHLVNSINAIKIVR